MKTATINQTEVINDLLRINKRKATIEVSNKC